MNSGVFLERNGVLNLTRLERYHQVNPLTLDEFMINPAAIVPLQRLKEAGFVLLATTNQPGLSLGYLSRRELDRMHTLLKWWFPMDAIYTCPHDQTDDCPCRKPKPGLLFEAAHQWRLDLDKCFVVSDKWQDAMAAHNAGCTSLLVKSPWNGPGHHDFVLPSLPHAVDKILQIHCSPYTMARTWEEQEATNQR